MYCGECGFENPEGSGHCGQCGAALDRICTVCGTSNPARFRFCGNCGSPIGPARGQPPPSTRGRRADDAPVPVAERRHLTVMFCDLVGSTALSLRMDPEELREVVRAYQAACAEVIERYDGYVAQYLGDGILAYFGYPVAHEDEGGRAARAGLGVVRAIERLGGRLSLPQDVMLAVRIGIHTGEVVVGEVGGGTRREHLALGDAPNIAARLQSIAAPNSVVMSADTRRLLDAAVEVEDLGQPALAGVGTHGHVFRVVGEQTPDAVDSAAATEFVGREPELTFLRDRWADAQQGRGQVVVLLGDPGIGKSRLVREFVSQAGFTACNRLETRSLPYYRNTAFFPFVDLLRRSLGCDPEQPAEERLQTIATMLEREGFPLDETVPIFADLMSVPIDGAHARPGEPPAILKERTRTALIRLVLGSAKAMPLILVVEDLHWTDPSSLELLDEIVPLVVDTPLMVLFTARPEFDLRWTRFEHVTHVAIRRLGEPDVQSLVRRVAGGRGLPTGVMDTIVARTDGVPLFVEELTRMVIESGMLTESDGAVATTVPPPFAIPGTLRDSLEARLDRLGPAKALAQLAATLGREFEYDLIRAVADLPEDALRAGITILVEAGLLLEDGEPPEAHYSFKHALIQEAAYQSLLRTTRQAHHLRTADVLLTLFPETARTQPELLAHHYTAAGLAVEAVEAWTRAGRLALQRSANNEAVAHLRQGLELVDRIPDATHRVHAELDLLSLLAPALVTTRGYAADEVRSVYARARSLATTSHRVRHLSQMLVGLFAHHHVRGELDAAAAAAEELRSLADDNPEDDTVRIAAHAALGVTGFSSGDLAAGLDHLDRVARGYDPVRHGPMAIAYGQDSGVVALAYSAYLLALAGRADEARARAIRGVELAERIDHPHSLALALALRGSMLQLLQDADEVRVMAQRLLDLARAQGFAHWEVEALHLQSWLASVDGQVDEAFRFTGECAAAARLLGGPMPQSFYQPTAIGLLLQAGRAMDALRAAEELLTALGQRRIHWGFEPEVHRLRALALAELGSGNAADAALTLAIELAERRGARLLALRAAVDRAQLRARGGRDDAEGIELLRGLIADLAPAGDEVDLERARDVIARLDAAAPA